MSDRLNNEFLALPDTVRWNLERADGYIDLQLLDRARKELEEIPDEFSTALPCFQIRMRLAVALRLAPTTWSSISLRLLSSPASTCSISLDRLV